MEMPTLQEQSDTLKKLIKDEEENVRERERWVVESKTKLQALKNNAETIENALNEEASS